MADDWIPTDEASKISNYNAEYLRSLVRDKIIKGRKFGYAIQISKSSLLAYLRKQSARGEKRGRKAN